MQVSGATYNHSKNLLPATAAGSDIRLGSLMDVIARSVDTVGVVQVSDTVSLRDSILVLEPASVGGTRRIHWLHKGMADIQANRDALNWFIGEVNYASLLANLDSAILLARVEAADETVLPVETDLADLYTRISNHATPTTFDEISRLWLPDDTGEMQVELPPQQPLRETLWPPILVHQKLVRLVAANRALYVESLPGDPVWRPRDIRRRCLIVPNYAAEATGYSPLSMRFDDVLYAVFLNASTRDAERAQLERQLRVSVMDEDSRPPPLVEINLDGEGVYTVFKIVRALASLPRVTGETIASLLQSPVTAMSAEERAEMDASRLAGVQWDHILAVQCTTAQMGAPQLRLAQMILANTKRLVQPPGDEAALLDALRAVRARALSKK